MDKCNKCQQEITNDNSYTLQKGNNSIKVCATCFKNNETSYMKGYDAVIKGSSQIIKELKPKIEGEESNFFECHKCHGVRDYEKLTDSEIEKGCPNCQSKDFELKISLWNGVLHYKIKECSKCHKMDMADLIKWPDSDNTKGKSKEEVIKLLKQEKVNDEDACQCSPSQKDKDEENDNPPPPNGNDNNRERERERETKMDLIGNLH